MEKCFCHLGEYVVKDATARNDIETLKTKVETLENAEPSTGGTLNKYEANVAKNAKWLKEIVKNAKGRLIVKDNNNSGLEYQAFTDGDLSFCSYLSSSMVFGTVRTQGMSSYDSASVYAYKPSITEGATTLNTHSISKPSLKVTYWNDVEIPTPQ